MSGSKKRLVALPVQQARYVDSLVEAGTYASASDVVCAGLRALKERDEAVERWLREDVLPVYDAMQRDPGRAVSSEAVIARLRSRHAERLKRAKRDP